MKNEVDASKLMIQLDNFKDEGVMSINKVIDPVDSKATIIEVS